MPKRADVIVHVATIGEGHHETATWNSERAGRRIKHADGGGGVESDAGTGKPKD